MNIEVPWRERGQINGAGGLDLGEARASAVGGSPAGSWGGASSRFGAAGVMESGVVLPAPLRWLLEVVLELRWPAADEDDLHSAAEVWRHLGGQVVEAHRATEPAAGAIVSYNAGPAVDGFAQFWERFSTRPVPCAVSVCTRLERMLRQFADDVTEVKAYILRHLETLADEVELRVSATGVTLGVSTTTAKAAATTTRAAVGAALAELSVRAATTARTGAAASRAAATELLIDPTMATLRQFDERRTLDPGPWPLPGTPGTVAGPPGAPPARIGPTSLVHVPIQDGADQLTHASSSPLTDGAHISAPLRPADADSPGSLSVATASPETATAGASAAAQHSLISRAMAGED